ncbi:MAG: primosomal protein N' [Gammaproteobacteria bacterium]|nr:primosomal protein N' [Gammaproteobacteria bacterium]|tara:strand:+ start:87428 stop:89698 length:2271 start_codon:yes stop_codon:yes gene_type:complete
MTTELHTDSVQATSDQPQTLYVQVALPIPLHTLFDYRIPEKYKHLTEDTNTLMGVRVEVPFGNRKMTGFVMGVSAEPSYAGGKIRALSNFIDEEAFVPEEVLKLARWCSQYYFFPIGDSIATMIPSVIRQGKSLDRYEHQRWSLTTLGEVTPLEELKGISGIQKTALELLHEHQSMSLTLLQSFKVRSSTLEALAKKKLVEKIEITTQEQTPDIIRSLPPQLTLEQQQVIKDISDTQGRHLLFGVTGSGKTEVYMDLIHKVLEQGKQALVLVPEIGLTPQTMARFHKRFNCHISVLHSQQSETERAQEWLAAAAGHADLVIGTRSAVFTPMPRLGIIIIDEEHDQSYKQQDGMRYSARDIAILRAQWQKCSIVMGSATPSLETLYNVQHKGFLLHTMKQRASGVTMPDLKLVDLRRENCQQGIAHTVLEAMKKTLKQGQQVLVFLNRRGFAPAVICNDCGWTADCPECDAKLTLHRGSHKLKCHHCEYTTGVPFQCPMCQSVHLNPHGKGTERVEETLQNHFKEPVIRVDRDTMTTQTRFNACLDRINTGEPMILLGTQMLSKGHDFLGVHLVVVLDIDNGLFSSDFRAEEKTSQLLAQVGGRAGRGQKRGQVLVQTYQPDHPLFTHWVEHDYHATSRYLLKQRQETGLPPYSYHILLRAEAPNSQNTRDFLLDSRDAFVNALDQHPELSLEDVLILGPVNAAMERKAGVHRYHLLLQGLDRLKLHKLVASVFHILINLPTAKKVRWALEIDPQDF